MKKSMLILILYLLLFALMFAVSVYNYMINEPVLDLGMSARMTNMGLIFLSVLGILKSTWHIISF